MAKIVLSELAPDEAIHFSLAGAELDLGGKSGAKSFETSDRELLSNASAHPWLNVEYEAADELGGQYSDRQVRPEDDPHSALGPRANDPFDPEKVKATLEAQAEADGTIVAVEAGLDQSETVVTGPVAETLAADPDHEGAKSARAFQTPTDEGDAS